MSTEGNNIGYILSMQVGGLLHFHYREIEELINSGINITIFPTKYSEGPYMPKKDWDCYVYHPLSVLLKQPKYFFTIGPSKYVRLFFEAIKSNSIIEFMIACDFSDQMEKRKIKWIHCHFGDRKLFVGYFCKRILNIPLSVTIHAHELYANPNWKMFKKSLDLCDEIIAISDYNKNLLLNRLDIDEKKVDVIRLFVNIGDSNATKILIVGQIAERKGQDILFKAVKKINRKDIKIWVVGGEWEKDKEYNIDTLSNLAEEIGIKENVVFFGQVSDEILKILYKSCDIFCLPSRTPRSGQKEGIPVTLMEVMSYGKPVISTRHSGIPELVEEILVEENNIDDLAKAIELLVANPDLRRKLGERNREIIEEKYSKNNVLKLRDIFLKRGESKNA